MAKKKNPVLVSDLVGVINDIAPFRLAEHWDNVGLQFGSPSNPAGKVLVALEVSPAVIAEAKRLGVGTLVTHHPLLFVPPKSFAETTPVTQMGAELIRAGINLIAAHTNLDSVAHGTNGEIADRLKLDDRRFLKALPNSADSVKYVVFVPTSHVDAVIEAIASAGAGVIGQYSHCTFRSPGTGTYTPMDGAKPYAGKIGKFEEATDEVRLECVCPKSNLARLIDKVRAAHPYQEVAFDVYPLEPTGARQYGMGCIGKLSKATTLAQFVRTCKRAFCIKSIGVVGPDDKPIERVAICSGAGGSFISGWKPGSADVFVTGEMTHHQAADARERGLAVVLVGHFNSEAIVSPRFAKMIADHPRLAGRDLNIAVSKDEATPVRRL
ncbi:Nif3-like dinuclear metal center hexameric protein [bacterium]|nr:Nif3-like dinuclear metal center hexameric protein [bacterium]